MKPPGNERVAVFLLTTALLCTLSAVGTCVDVSQFSPDSWAYFELAKSVFSSKFYSYNTIRSYYFETYSSSFPPGYPVLIALAMLVIGQAPEASLAVNIAAATFTFALTWKTSKNIGLSSIGSAISALSITLYPHYLNEVLSGRAIPVAILFFIMSIYLAVGGRALLGGLFLGLSAITRFDHLAFAAATLVGLPAARRFDRKKTGLYGAGFLLGIVPWVAYSYTHFGKPWISDNAWVALSASPAYVLDYPARAALSITDAPTLWMRRIAGNLVPLLDSLVTASLLYPALLIFGVACFVGLLRRRPAHQFILGMIASLTALSMVPYLLTGYYDPRYFSLPLLAATVCSIYCTESAYPNLGSRRKYAIFSFLPLLLCTMTGARYLVASVENGMNFSASDHVTRQIIEKLSRCHGRSPDYVYIFSGDAAWITARYGATTGFRTAFIPSNFDRMTKVEKSAYLDYMRPYRFIDSLEGNLDCD